MQEPYFWYVFYVKTNTEPRVMCDVGQFVATHRFEHEFEAFCPESEVYYRKYRHVPGRQYRKRPLFPGYVFVETTMPEAEFLREFGTFVFGSADIIRLLRSGDNRIALPSDERQRLEYLLRGKRCFERSSGVIIGDKVCVTDGPLKGREGSITKINRHNHSADIELDLFGGKTKVTVALEIIDRS
ncbi:MAG: antiterminator LoaP [Clostridia bacterium]|nr:antiterminator LoaP [Clostridia bacterium]